jgi:ribosomal protein L37AE/L43A
MLLEIKMQVRQITQEQVDNEDYPECSRCTRYQNARSSVYGDCWTCVKGHCSVDVDDNSYDLEVNKDLKIHDCGDYKNGKPTICNLG